MCRVCDHWLSDVPLLSSENWNPCNILQDIFQDLKRERIFLTKSSEKLAKKTFSFKNLKDESQLNFPHRINVLQLP